MKYSTIFYVFCLTGFLFGFANAKGSHKVQCTEDLMRVEIVIPSQDKSAGGTSTTTTAPSQIYLEGLKGYPDVRCQPTINETLAEFRLSLKDFYECGVTRMVNKLTGKTVYYHKIIMESDHSKEIISVKCITTGPIYNTMLLNQTNYHHNLNGGKTLLHGIVRRDVLPAGFQEPEDLEITTSFTEHAPDPILGVGVRQGGNIITGDLNVSPGTPLSMEIYLDKESAPVYGLGVTYMQVTDTKAQEETIIFNGCSVDPYLFENFNTVDGDFLNAKFRAFKFPESTYVQFRATVNVCLDKCQGTPCSNGQTGYGKRRRREVKHTSPDPNKVYEISLATFIKVEELESINRNEVLKLEEKLRQLKIANQRLARNSRGSTLETMKSMDQLQLDTATVVEEESLLKFSKTSSAQATSASLMLLPILTVVKLIL